MSKRNFKRFAIFAFMLSAFVFASCDKNDNDKSRSMLDGTYIHQTHSAYKIVIQGNSWTSMINGSNYGKGTYTLSNDNKASGHSTHAWNNGTWVPYSNDAFSGTYNEGSRSFTITTTGNDTNFNGTYLCQ